MTIIIMGITITIIIAIITIPMITVIILTEILHIAEEMVTQRRNLVFG